ncbi:SRPBCC domain-containing protein [Ramlibacter sp.]|uniref:SRPBCC domain-containing protein n=1 Tax=Ramlibacter sp. TaxID=1917967 RepID=UPI002627F556|nr:SRPBCC domain-containing protein [Ramlibacter sp.]MDB5955164.1 carbon monoxide dehydrogenase [Ramlibacter sp.]
MKVQIEKSFPLAASADAAWALLQDLEAVTQCMPGARITEHVDASHFKGTVGVRVGPASMAFRGEVEVREIDAATRSLHLIGRGTDNTGTSGAAMDLRAHIEPDGPAACKLVGLSEVSVSGKAATFGGRLMSGVADQVLQQFAANFAKRLPPAPQEPVVATPVVATPVVADAAATEPPLTPPIAVAAAATPATITTAMPVAEAPVRDINGLALLWGMVRDWFHHLFEAKRA